MSKWRVNVRDMAGALIDTINCDRRFEIGERLSVICPMKWHPMAMLSDDPILPVCYLQQVDGRVRELQATREVCITLNAPEAAVYRKALRESKPDGILEDGE